MDLAAHGDGEVCNVTPCRWGWGPPIFPFRLRALVAAGFDEDYTVVYEIRRDSHGLVFSVITPRMSMVGCSPLRRTGGHHMARLLRPKRLTRPAGPSMWGVYTLDGVEAYLLACQNALAALTVGGTPAFEVEVFRGSSLDTSPLEVEGDIEIINWRDTMSFRRTVLAAAGDPSTLSGCLGGSDTRGASTGRGRKSSPTW